MPGLPWRVFAWWRVDPGNPRLSLRTGPRSAVSWGLSGRVWHAVPKWPREQAARASDDFRWRGVEPSRRRTRALRARPSPHGGASPRGGAKAKPGQRGQGQSRTARTRPREAAGRAGTGGGVPRGRGRPRLGTSGPGRLDLQVVDQHAFDLQFESRCRASPRTGGERVERAALVQVDQAERRPAGR